MRLFRGKRDDRFLTADYNEAESENTWSVTLQVHDEEMTLLTRRAFVKPHTTNLAEWVRNYIITLMDKKAFDITIENHGVPIEGIDNKFIRRVNSEFQGTLRYEGTISKCSAHPLSEKGVYIITHNLIDGEGTINASLVKYEKDTYPIKFRLFDGDDERYFSGRMVEGNDGYILDTLGAMYGCTDIQTQTETNGAWRSL